MDEQKKEYRISVCRWYKENGSRDWIEGDDGNWYPVDYDDGEEFSEEISEILMETGDIEEFYRKTRDELQAFVVPEEEIELYGKGGTLQFEFGGGEKNLFLRPPRENSDFTFILYLFAEREYFGATFKAFSYGSDSHTDISEMECSDNDSHYRVSFFAKKNGGDKKLYFCGPNGETVAKEDISVRCLRRGNRIFASYAQPKCHSFDKLCNSGEFSSEEIDNILANNEEVKYVYLKSDGEDVTFSINKDGKPYKIISRDDKKVVFYDTPYDMLGTEGFRPDEQDGNPKNIVFERDGDKYLYRPGGDVESRFLDDVIFTPPRMQDAGRIGPDHITRLFEGYLCAFQDAFAGVKKYRAHIGSKSRVFERDDTSDMFRSDFKDFTLTAKFELPMLCDTYDMENTCHINNIESVSFEGENKTDKIKVTMTNFASPDNIKDAIDGDILAICFIESPMFDVAIGIRTLSLTFDELREKGVFLEAGLPDAIYFSRQLADFTDDIEYYEKIKGAIIGYVSDNHNIGADRISLEEMEKRLYPAQNGWEPDKAVVSFAAELYNYYRDTVKIPNVAIIGEAGTGKSSVVKKIGKTVFDRDVLALSPSDLKGPYLGQTRSVVAAVLVEAAIGKKIIFIDEAYELMSDDFGREAVSFLLPFMTGDRTAFTLGMVETHSFDLIGENGETVTTIFENRIGSDDVISVDFITGEVKKNGETVDGKIPTGIPPVWIGGYEDEIRLLLRQNQGLYRRFRKCRLKKPRTDQLYSAFDSQFKKMKEEIDPEIYKKLDPLFEKNKESIKNFFRWGSQPQFSKYFANYAGVGLFLKRCLYTGDADTKKDNDYIPPDIEAIIESMKKDIKRQYNTVRLKGGNTGRNGNSNASIDASEQVQIIVDNKTRFSDIVGSGRPEARNVNAKSKNQAGHDGNTAKGNSQQFKKQVDFMDRIIDMLVNKADYEKRGITIPKGALMEGPPGVGKTFIARAMAGELEARFIEKNPKARVGFMALSGSELTSSPPIFISNIFDSADEYDVCVMFIDEVDSVAKRRSENNHYSHLTELIKQMDGIDGRSNIIFVLAATNVVHESLDPAFTRAGRIDKRLSFELPNSDTRRELARRNITKRTLIKIDKHKYDKYEAGVNMLASEIAKRTPERTPGDIENIVNNAFTEYWNNQSKRPKFEEMIKLNKINFGHRELDYLYCYLDDAIETYLVGDLIPIKKDETFSTAENDKGRSATCVHEAGHALVALKCGNSFEKITSIARGDSLGYVQTTQRLWTKSDYEKSICISMGGRIAEEIVYGKDQISAGASGDMQNATKCARLMVERLGFSDEFGFMALTEDTQKHLGESGYSCSIMFREQSDRAVREILKKLYHETREMLMNEKKLITDLAEKVFNEYEMTGDKFKEEYDSLVSKK